MARRKRVDTTSGQGYPSLSQYVCERRQFLRKLALGAVTLGLGSRVLSACTSTGGIIGNPDPRTLHTVRLPGEGFASAYISFDNYLRYSVTITTYNEALAVYFRSPESEGLTVMAMALSATTCEDYDGPLGSIEAALQAALEEHYFDLFADEGPGLETVQLLVETCEFAAMDGGMEEPSPYP
ncbi:MAG: twin-arginine translocation signal domain-containing protein [Deltaproteobacteria bacterium]|nr:twin-arginine translocation signal domain-containing protein [Deltaproteobacteria bacterium]